MKKIILIMCLLPTPACGADYDAGSIDFCARGKILIFTGNCIPPKGSAFKDSISRKACMDVKSALVSGLSVLYPYAKIYVYADLDPEAVYRQISQMSVLGFFLIGQGDVSGGLVNGAGVKTLYPSEGVCLSSPDVFGGFSSHSKYSPDSPAPQKLRRSMLARVELMENGIGSSMGSWPQLCKPALSMVYPTRTFAGRMKEDALKFISGLMEGKRGQALEALESICGACDQYVRAGYPLAKLCPPNSDVCALKRITPGSERLVMDNYCLLLHPEYAVPSGE